MRITTTGSAETMMKFRHVFIDEAGQAHEPECIIPVGLAEDDGQVANGVLLLLFLLIDFIGTDIGLLWVLEIENLAFILFLSLFKPRLRFLMIL